MIGSILRIVKQVIYCVRDWRERKYVEKIVKKIDNNTKQLAELITRFDNCKYTHTEEFENRINIKGARGMVFEIEEGKK